MGHCCSKTSNKCNQPSLSQSELKGKLIIKRAEAVTMIHKLHLIYLSCKYGIESCVFNSNRALVLVLKQKQHHINQKIKLLQSSIKTIDDSIDFVGISLSRKKQMLLDLESLLTCNQTALLSDNTSLILENNVKTISSIKNELKLSPMDLTEIELEVDAAFNKHSKSSKTNFTRKRYSRRFKTA